MWGSVMCRYEETSLAPEPSSAGRARVWVAERLAAWGIDTIVDDLRLVVTELVSNAALHARTTIDIILSIGEGFIELVVRDHNPRTPRPRPHQADSTATGGRGLMLVEALSDDWGVAERMDGKDVWFRLAAPSGWPYADLCVCAETTDSEVRRLASGRRVIVLSPGPLPGTA